MLRSSFPISSLLSVFVMFLAFPHEDTSGNWEAPSSSISMQRKKEVGSRRPGNCHELSCIFRFSVFRIGNCLGAATFFYWFVEFSQILFCLLFLTWLPHGSNECLWFTVLLTSLLTVLFFFAEFVLRNLMIRFSVFREAS